jgi:hypothetical protein
MIVTNFWLDDQVASEPTYAGQYFMAFKAKALPKNATGRNYSWASFNIEFAKDCPSGADDSCDLDYVSWMQVGLLTTKDGVYWFVYAEPDHTVTCVRGQKTWVHFRGSAGCIGGKLQLGRWYGFDLRADGPTARTSSVMDSPRKITPNGSSNGREIARVTLESFSRYWIHSADSIFGVTRVC